MGRHRKRRPICGIIGVVGDRPVADVVVRGLEQLEYRGYDSAGIALLEASGMRCVRAVGNLGCLKEALGRERMTAAIAIGHTRWATHGRVSVDNAHPLGACDERELVVVLNGIVENYHDLRRELAAESHILRSETDAEVVAHLVERAYEGDLVEAARVVVPQLEGRFAFVLLHRAHPRMLVGARQGCPLVVGLGEGANYVASMTSAFVADCRLAKFMDDGEVVELSAEDARFFAVDGEELHHEPVEIDWDESVCEKDGFETFMLKEIHEQPHAVARTTAGRTGLGRITLEPIGLGDEELRHLDRIVVVACGTAYHAGVIGRYAIEGWARIPCEPDIASEWRYREPVVRPGTLVIGISQSGETADTLAALRLARQVGAHTLAVTNMSGSQICREADAVLYTRAGLEMGVAATKTFTAQAVLMLMIALHLAQARGTLAPSEIAALVEEIEELPRLISSFLDGSHPVSEIADRHRGDRFFLYLGRHMGLPVCLEGALKLKEISYIPTDAYSGGEMKHGPIALLDESTPVVCIATDGHVYGKVVSNIQEVRARGARVIAVATDGNEAIQHVADDVVYVPRTHPFLQPILAVLPLQLFAYDIARRHGRNVDQPRNLAKTVTVE